jgi:hypothetical protein
VLENFSDKITSDSARFEITKIPGALKTTAKAGTITNIVKNKDDNSASFAVIFKIIHYLLKKHLQMPAEMLFLTSRIQLIKNGSQT